MFQQFFIRTAPSGPPIQRSLSIQALPRQYVHGPSRNLSDFLHRESEQKRTPAEDAQSEDESDERQPNVIMDTNSVVCEMNGEPQEDEHEHVHSVLHTQRQTPEKKTVRKRTVRRVPNE